MPLFSEGPGAWTWTEEGKRSISVEFRRAFIALFECIWILFVVGSLLIELPPSSI